MQRILAAVLLALIVLPVAGSERDVISYRYVLKLEKRGITQYKRENYEKAFEAFSETARLGLKQSQYYLAFMFLKGQHVEQSVVLGMGWLGVAAEADIDEWTQNFQTIYDAASPRMRERIDSKVAEYIDKFGAKTQRVTCTTRAQIGSRRPYTECFKVPNTTTPWYELELAEPSAAAHPVKWREVSE